MSTRHGAGCLATTGYSPEDYAADPDLWINVVHPDDCERVQRHLAKVLAAENVPPIEHRILHKDATIRWVRDTIVQHCDEAGSLVRYDGVIEEVTERKQAEEELKRNNAIMTAVKEVFERALVCDSSEEVAQTCLVVAEKLTGSKFGFIGELNQAGLFDTIAMSDPGWDACKMPESDAMRLTENMKIRGYHKAALRDGESRIVNDPASHPDRVGIPEGHPPITCFLGVPLKYGDETIGMIGLANKESGYDLTDKQAVETLCVSFVEALMHKEAEEALRNKAEELRQAQKMEAVGGLAGGIAHEFNNLLQAIDGYTNYAMEGLSAEEQRYQDLQQVRKATDRAATLTRQLLGFSRRQVLRRKNVDPNHVVADLTKLVRPVIGEHIQLELSLADNVGTVYADPGELQQVLLNLSLNARDAMPTGGTLFLKTENRVLSEAFCEHHPDASPGRYVVLSITDTGRGIPPEVKEHIFEPFFTTKEVGDGTGLGLATVYGIVQQHEGVIRVYSELGKGTTFKVYLPTADVAADTESSEQATAPPGGTETILVAEDEPMVRDIAKRILENAGYTVLTANDGEEALQAFDANRNNISLVLLDAVMPRLNGHEVYRRIRAENPEVKVVFCTGYDPETAQSTFIMKENLRLVQKPFGPDTLLCTLREVLDMEEPCQVAQTTG